jgi:hypothetical protein
MLGLDLFAYGPAPGMEFIPQFLQMLAFVGLAFFSILLWPITMLLRRFRGGRQAPEAEAKNETAPPSVSSDQMG